MAEIREATWDDLDAVFELLDRRSRLVLGISEEQLEYLRQRWERPRYDKWVAVASGTVVGYAGLDEDQDFVHAASEPATADALLAHVELRGCERGFDRLATIAAPDDEPLLSALRRNGYALDREIHRMWRSRAGTLTEPAWPDPLSVRTYGPDDGARVQALLDETYAGWDRDYVARSHEGWLSFMTEHDDFDPAMWFLVERDGKLVACALYWRAHAGRGWLKDIVVRESERGRGLGRALIEHGLREYAARGVDRVGLKVDTTNPTGAIALYARLGFVTDQRLQIWAKEL